VIIDAVIHAYNFTPENLIYPPYSQRFGAGTYAHHKMWSPADSPYILTEDEFVRDFDEQDTADAVFAESPVDLAAFHATPIYDFFADGMVSIEKGARLKEAQPDRVLFYGPVSLLDVKSAIRTVEELVSTYGIDGVKFYPAVFTEGKTIFTSLADEDVAFKVVERAASLGVKNFAVHKALPLGPASIKPYGVDDVATVAGAFPELNFQVVHAGVAFTEEMAMLLGRFPNVYANLEGTFGYICRKPRAFFESIGLMAEWSSYEQLIFASGCEVAHPAPLIKAFLAAEMPEDLVHEHGFPPLTAEAKAAVLGGNFARLHGITELPASLADDEFARKAATDPQPWSRLRERAAAAA
jgi:predicted TIM-barrel fold metal-dependent hydrolase